jgi:AcrR family transcriptional regulator
MTKTADSRLAKPKRRRRTPESARREILDAAGKRLKEEGPDGLRLQAIAGDLEISHSSILHHFGSRDGLLDALSIDAFYLLERDLKRSVATPSEGDPATDLIEKIADILGEQGHARLLAWQLMGGRRLGEAGPTRSAPGHGGGGLLDRLAHTLHKMRLEDAKAQSQPAPPLDETREIVAMAGCVLFGEALAGDFMLQSAALSTDRDARTRFRQRLARTVERSLFPTNATPGDPPD